nr:2Fe-2S iron-sulfur cluster binding domain-containing protein [Rhodococcus sp. USK13]
MDKVVAVAREHVAPDAIHLENFHASEQPDSSENTAFAVELDGSTYQIPADKSIVEVLQDNGCDIDTSCQSAGPASCRTSKAHPNTATTCSPKPKESGQVLAVCVSRAKGPRLVLDYC